MTKVVFPTFTINCASKTKKVINHTGTISRKCLAVVTKVDGEFKAIINYDKKNLDITDTFTLKNEVLILPFTENSLSLKDKTCVFLKEKDDTNHYVCVMRDIAKASISPGIKEQYDVFKENFLISGHIVRKDKKMYFDYDDLISYNYLSNFRIKEVDIDMTKPLFNK